MRSEKTIYNERRRLRRMIFGMPSMGEWRTGFNHGVLQALTWVIEMTDGKPTHGFELKLLGKGGSRRK